MHFKRLFTVLIALSTILILNTSCGNDRDLEDTESKLELTDLANTYATNTLIVNAHEAETEQKVEVTVNNDNTATFKLFNMVEGYPETTFTTAIEKGKQGIYKFDQTEHLMQEDGGLSYHFSGAFIGAEKTKVSLVVDFKKVNHTTIDDIIKYKQLNGSSGQFFQNTLFVNGQPMVSELKPTSSSQAVRFTQTASTGKINVAIANPFFNVGTISITDIQLVRGTEKPNVFTFVHEPFVNDNNFRTVTITKGVYDNGVIYIECNIGSKFDHMGIEWQIDPANKDNFAITLISSDAAEKPKDEARIEFIKKHANVFIPLLIRANSVKFNDDVSTDFTYLTNDKGIVKLKAQGGYKLFSQTFMNFGLSEAAMKEIVAQSNDRVTMDDMSSLFPTTAGLYGLFPLYFLNTSSDNIKTLTLNSSSQVAPFAALAAKSMPTTVADMQKMGFTMTQGDIDMLKAIFTHMSGSKNAKSQVIVGLKKAN